MSGAIIELVSKGVQDAFLTGDPEVSFFRQNFKRHTNYSTKPIKLNVIGSQVAGSEIMIPIDRRGDLLTGVWASCPAGVEEDLGNSEFTLNIGGQRVDRQDIFYMNQLYQKFLVNSGAKAMARYTNITAGDNIDRTNINASTFLPLTFSFFNDTTNALPLVALQYHDVEIRVKFIGATSPENVSFYAEYAQLDTDERKFFAEGKHEILFTQVQKIGAESTGADLSYLNHPVKCLLWCPTSSTAELATSNVSFQVNGTDVFETPMPDLYFTSVQGYYHSEHASPLLRGAGAANGGPLKMYSFANCVNKVQPTGSCNFSRLDNSKISWTTSDTIDSIYAVNYNIFRIQSGMGGVAFSN